MDIERRKMKDTKTAPEPLQAEEYIKKMMKKKRLLTGVELGNCLLCRIGYDIAEPTDEFILNTLNHWTSQADFDAYYLRLEIRNFLLLLHNSATYAQAKGHAEGLNLLLINNEIATQALFYARMNTLLKRDAKRNTENPTAEQKAFTLTLQDYKDRTAESLKESVNALINDVANKAINAFTDSLTFILNTDKIIEIIAEHFNLDLHTYHAKKDRTALLWVGVNSFDDKHLTGTIKSFYQDNIIDGETLNKTINTIKQASDIDTQEATEDEIKEVKDALKEMKTQADFLHLREWIIKTMIKTTRFI